MPSFSLRTIVQYNERLLEADATKGDWWQRGDGSEAHPEKGCEGP